MWPKAACQKHKTLQIKCLPYLGGKALTKYATAGLGSSVCRWDGDSDRAMYGLAGGTVLPHRATSEVGTAAVWGHVCAPLCVCMGVCVMPRQLSRRRLLSARWHNLTVRQTRNEEQIYKRQAAKLMQLKRQINAQWKSNSSNKRATAAHFAAWADNHLKTFGLSSFWRP